jgi:hypothetical protein
MSNRLQKGSIAEPALEGATAGAAATPTANLNSLPRLTPELSWNG